MNDSHTETGLTPGGVLLRVLALVMGGFALVLMYQGLGFVGVTVWGYNDSEASFYIVVGLFFLLVGVTIFFLAALLAVRIIGRPRRQRSAGGTATAHRPWFLAAGCTLLTLGIPLIGMAVAALLATPDDTSRIDVTALAAVLAATGLTSTGVGGLMAHSWFRA